MKKKIGLYALPFALIFVSACGAPNSANKAQTQTVTSAKQAQTVAAQPGDQTTSGSSATDGTVGNGAELIAIGAAVDAAKGTATLSLGATDGMRAIKFVLQGNGVNALVNAAIVEKTNRVYMAQTACSDPSCAEIGVVLVTESLDGSTVASPAKAYILKKQGSTYTTAKRAEQYFTTANEALTEMRESLFYGY